jgi:predicted nucleic acid-binding protein
LSVVFADTSALIKRDVPETGSPWVQAWFAPGQDTILVISELTIVELSSALARRERDGSIPPAVATTFRNDVTFHIEHVYLVVRLQSDIIAEASRLVSVHPIRTLDAIQLAAARESISLLGSTPTFISADQRLLAAAALEGFPIDNPNAH